MRRVFKYIGIGLLITSLIVGIISIFMLTSNNIETKQSGIILISISLLTFLVSFIMVDTSW